MPNRRLNVDRYFEGVPMEGHCDKCGARFKVNPDFIRNPEKAREQLIAMFEQHQCPANQSA